jgi:L-ribulokinase
MAIGESRAGSRRVRRGEGIDHPARTGIEAGLSATGDIFDAIARRAGTTVAELSRGLENYRAGETGLLRLTWDNGDRTVLVNPELGGITLGWNLTHTAQDELFAAIEGTAFHTRVILERMESTACPSGASSTAAAFRRRTRC